MFNEFTQKIARYKSTLPTVTDGNLEELQVDASGRLIITTSGSTLAVSLASVPTHDVTNAGTFVVQVDGDALTSLQLIDNIVLAEDDPHVSGEAGVLGLVVRNDVAGSLVSADGDRSPLQVDDQGALRISGSLSTTVDDVFESGTETDTSTDPAGDGVLVINSAGMTDLVTIAVGAGETLYIVGFDFVADEQAFFQLIVDDNGTPSEFVRAGGVNGLDPDHREYKRAIEIAGAANRSVILRARSIVEATANASGGINAYKR